MTPNLSAIRIPSSRRRAFTLVEVMISVALALLLMYGVSQVFKLSSDATGANQAVSAMVRDQRAAGSTMAEDFRNVAPDAPLFLISQRIAYAGSGAVAESVNGDAPQVRGFRAGFRNLDEQRNNPAGSSGADPNDPTTVDGNSVPFIRLGTTSRVPRIDRLGFFTRSLYQRQMPASNGAAAGATAAEAYVWYGHTIYPRAVGNGTPIYAGQAGLLPENQYLSERILGRVTILLRQDPTKAYLPWVGGLNSIPSSPPNLWPLDWASKPFNSIGDVAPISLEDFRRSANSAYQSIGANWYRPMEDDKTLSPTQITRFFCEPKVGRPIDSAKLSQAVPFFMGNCTQFIVEYAGDYLNQPEYDPAHPDVPPGAVVDVGQYVDPASGNVVQGQTDGQIDYVVDTSGDTSDPPSDPTKWVRRVRWYGLPRDVNGDNKITINDTVPLADVIAYWFGAPLGTFKPKGVKNSPIAPWESVLPVISLEHGSVGNDTDLPSRKFEPFAQKNYILSNTNPADFAYTCAWHNDAPRMIRVLIKLDDPTGKLQDGQWYEYVFSR